LRDDVTATLMQFGNHPHHPLKAGRGGMSNDVPELRTRERFEARRIEAF